MTTACNTFARAHRPVPMPIVWRFASTALIAAFALLLVMPFAVVTLAERGVSAMAVGTFAFLTPTVMVVLILVLPRLTALVGRVIAVRIGLVAGALAAAGFATTESYALWCLFAMLAGVQFAIHWTSVDTVLSENVPKERAGALIGLYQTLLAAAVASGPAAASWSGLSFREVAWVAVVLFVVALGLTFGALRRAIDRQTGDRAARKGLFAFMMRHPALLAIALLGGLFEVGTTAMGSVHALHLGFASAAAVLIASVVSAGSLVAQVPIGWLADRLSVPTMMRAAAAVLLASALALPLAQVEPRLLWLLAALWGAFGGALQTLVYMHIAVTRTGHDVQLGMVTMALGFTLGTLIGPGVGGLAKQLSPDHGFTVLLVSMSAAVLGLVLSKTAFGVKR